MSVDGIYSCLVFVALTLSKPGLATGQIKLLRTPNVPIFESEYVNGDRNLFALVAPEIHALSNQFVTEFFMDPAGRQIVCMHTRFEIPETVFPETMSCHSGSRFGR